MQHGQNVYCQGKNLDVLLYVPVDRLQYQQETWHILDPRWNMVAVQRVYENSVSEYHIFLGRTMSVPTIKRLDQTVVNRIAAGEVYIIISK